MLASNRVVEHGDSEHLLGSGRADSDLLLAAENAFWDNQLPPTSWRANSSGVASSEQRFSELGLGSFLPVSYVLLGGSVIAHTSASSEQKVSEQINSLTLVSEQTR